MGEHRPAVGGNVVFAILQPHSRSLGVGVDTPSLGEPAAISGVRTYQDNRGNQNDYKRIHYMNPSFLLNFTIACAYYFTAMFVICQ